MTITDIAEKQADDRKREKRLVHSVNSLTRDFTGVLKIKSNAERGRVEYLIKSFLDFVFFTERKEIAELSGPLMRRFMLDHCPARLTVDADTQKEAPALLGRFCEFLQAEGAIKTAEPLVAAVKDAGKDFQKIKFGKPKIVPAKKETKDAGTDAPIFSAVGRNDPCPCGSGKKYKKCHGKTPV